MYMHPLHVPMLLHNLRLLCISCIGKHFVIPIARKQVVTKTEIYRSLHVHSI